ncbi:superoxide dismutase family protein [Rhodoferax antarcticus]|nr:superoxide dismutase family protein [Rhodoferax antarcticus]
MEPTKGNSATGLLTFAKHGDKVRVFGELRGFVPNTEHGFHSHEKGDSSSGDGLSEARGV